MFNLPKDWFNIVDMFPRLSVNADLRSYHIILLCLGTLENFSADEILVKVPRVINDVIAALCLASPLHAKKKKNKKNKNTKVLRIYSVILIGFPL